LVRVQAHQRLGFDIYHDARVFQLGVGIHAFKEKRLHSDKRPLAKVIARVPEGFVNMLGCTVVAAVGWVAEAISVSVQRARRSDRFFARLAAIYQVQQLRFQPATRDVRILVEILEAGRLRQKVCFKSIKRVVLFEEPAVLAFVVNAREKHGQNPVHLQGFEIQVTNLGQAKKFVSAFKCHRAPVLRQPSSPVGLLGCG